MKTRWLRHLLACVTLGLALFCNANAASAQFQQTEEVDTQLPRRTARPHPKPRTRLRGAKSHQYSRGQGKLRDRVRKRSGPKHPTPQYAPVEQRQTVIPGREPYDPAIHVDR